MSSLEICVDSLPSLEAAIAGGADRIELCSALALGGLTPSLGLCERAVGRDAEIFGMLRPRAGSFLYRPEEMDMMLRDLEIMYEVGVDGIVFGAGDENGLNTEQCLRIIEASQGAMATSLHRVFDLKADLDNLELAIELGFVRILTSGGAKSAIKGAPMLQALQSEASRRIEIMAGAGVNTDAIAVLGAMGLRHFHASASYVQTADRALVEMGFSPAQIRETSLDAVKALRQAVDAIPSAT